MDSLNIQKLLDMKCCTGDDHTVREGGSHLNFIQTKYLGKWQFLAVTNALVPESYDYPLAAGCVCDRCIQQEKLELKYVIGGEGGEDGPEYFRVPIEELEEPEVFWPDLHPDRLKGS